MVTTVYFRKIYDGVRIFDTNIGETLWVESFENGIVTNSPEIGTYIPKFAEAIAGCLRVKSNFKREVLKAFEFPKDTPLTGIQFGANGATVLVTREIAYTKKILEKWYTEMEAAAEKRRLEWEAYTKTPEYRVKRAKELKIQTRREQVKKEVLDINESTEIEFKDDEAKANWEKWVEVNSNNGYSWGVVKYASYWAKYMQHLMKKHGKTVSEIADNASDVSGIEEISGFMYGCAVGILSECWKYGDELRKWHNKEWGHEDAEGVINPAVIIITQQ